MRASIKFEKLCKIFNTSKVNIPKLFKMIIMTECADIKVKYLSGGQQHRVALARVLALETEVLLLWSLEGNII